MNHPTREELLEFFDSELPSERQAEVAAHVAACDDCRSQGDAWREVRTALAAWELPEANDNANQRSRRIGAVRTGWRRPAAAAALVAAGFGLALVLAPRGDFSGNRAELAQEILRQVRAELTTFESKQQSHREELLAALDGRLDQLEVQWLVDYADLRRDIETLALGTQEGLRLLAGAAPSVDDSP